MAKESYFSSLTSKGVKCGICPHGCNLSEGQYGICKTRVVRDGKLYSEAYGKLCSFNEDPIEKKPLYHFLPGTLCLSMASVGCNFACLNCQNYSISQAKIGDLHLRDASPELIIETALATGSPTIAFTYTEPLTYYEYLYDTCKLAKENGLKTVLITAGYVNEKPLRDLCKYLDAVNVDLKAFSNEFYKKINNGTLEPVLNALKVIKEEGVWIEITNLIIPTLNDSDEMLTDMCKWLVENGFSDYPLHFSRFYPTYKLQEIPPTPSSTLIKAKAIATGEGIKYVYIGNAPEIEGENTCCPHCKKMLIHREGFKVIKNHLNGDRCPKCGTLIAGRWK